MAAAAVHVGAASPDVGAVRHTFCDDRGRFELGGLPRQSLHLVATGETATSALVAIDLTSTSERRDLEVVLDQARAITGTVVDRRGEPVAEARVVALPDAEAAVTYRSEVRLRGHASDIADSGGGFRLVGLAAGDYRLRAIRPGAATELFWMKQGELVTAGADPVTLVVDETTRVVGEVSLAGEPPALFNVTVGAGRPQSFAGGDGSFAIDEVPAGTTFVAIRGPEFESRILQKVRVEPGEETDLGTIEVRPGRAIRGRVIDGDGRPVAGASVFAGSQLTADGLALGAFRWGANDIRQTVSGADGSFVIRGNYAGSLVVAADHETLGRSRVADIPGGERDAVVELRLEPLGALEGRVSLAGKPIESKVVMRPQQGANTLYTVISSADGHYRFDKLSPGRYIVSALQQRGSGTGGGKGHATSVVIESGEVARADIDIPVGDIEVALEISSRAGNVEFGYGVLLGLHVIDKPVRMTLSEGRKILAGSKGGTLKEGMIVEDRTIRFSEIVPGDYTACAMPMPGDPRDPETMEAFQKGLVETEMFCRPLEVTESPTKQRVVVEVEMADS